MELYIIRHGETVWNAKGLLQGNADIELNENGREIAGRFGETLESVSFDRIYSSTLIRAYETACLIRGHRNIPIIRDERIKEIGFGVLEGHDYRECFAPGSPYFTFFTKPEDYPAPEGGEGFPEVIKRTGEFIREVIEPAAAECERIMIVAHGNSNKAIICNLLGSPIERFWGNGLQKNCEADIYLYENGVWRQKPGTESEIDARWGKPIE